VPVVRLGFLNPAAVPTEAVTMGVSGVHQRGDQRGVTLLELLVVVAVLGTLSGVAVLGVGQLRDRVEVAACATDERVLRTAQQAFRATNGTYGDAEELLGAGLIDDLPAHHSIVSDGLTFELVPVGPCSAGSVPQPVVLEEWNALMRAGDFEFGRDGAVLVRGAGERQALVNGHPFSSGTIELLGARSTTGNGWGIVFHGGIADNGSISGYVFQMDTGYSGGRFVLRERGGNGESRPLAVTAPPAGFDWRAPHDVVLVVAGNRMTAIVDGEPVMAVDDLAGRGATAGARSAHAEGQFGLRLWSNSDLRIERVSVRRS